MTTFNTSNSPASVAAAIDSALAAGEDNIVQIEATTANWTSTLTKTITRNLTIQGAGAVCATNGGLNTTGSDQTVIVDRHADAQHKLINLTVSTGKRVRLSAFRLTHDGSSQLTQSGIITVSGGSNAVRIDHCRFAVYEVGASATIRMSATTTGLIDHNYFDSAVGNGPIGLYIADPGGDAAWAAADAWGTSNFIFMEDNRFRNGYLGDMNLGGQRFVFRYNRVICEQGDSPAWQGGYFPNHGLTSARPRGSRAMEYYANVCSGVGAGLNKTPFPVNSGCALCWGNTISHYTGCIELGYTRKDNATYPYGSPSSGWGNCTGAAGTVWDGTGGAGHYPGLDQPGRGMGDLLSGATISATVNTRTGTQIWPQQALSPVYVWANTYTPGGFGTNSIVQPSAPAALVTANRDYYVQFGTYGESGSFNGSKGVGQGLLSSRPSSGLTVGVGYWATDTQTLYVATDSTTWATYYTPYTYPHPLQGGSSPPVGTPTLSVR